MIGYVAVKGNNEVCVECTSLVMSCSVYIWAYRFQMCRRLFHCLFRVPYTVTHIVQVERLFEHSMQYNEMYVSSKRTEGELLP